MSVQVYMNFSGNCRDAVEFYADVFECEKPQIMTFGDMPPSEGFVVTEDIRNLVMHSSLEIAGSLVMFSDVPPERPVIQGNNISLIVTLADEDEIRSAFNRLKEGGTVVMELQETFWSKCYGFLIDRFGIGWQFSQQSS